MSIYNPDPEHKKVALLRFDQILKKASHKKASDIHLKVGLPPVVRVNGHLYYLGEDSPGAGSVSKLSQAELIEVAYALMNPNQIEKFEDGREVDLGYETASGRFRINLCQQRSNPRLVCRHIPETIPIFKDLGLPPIVEKLALSQRGLILVTGATGSGKSTSLAAMIDHIARTQSCHIVTIEDPIEFLFKDRKSIVTQREVGLDTLNFAQALKYSLRQDPDVILVGEMRDEETILMALTASETGHLVFSTLHTMDAGETINRILANVSSASQNQVRAQFASVIVAVISQRLMRRKDGKGRIPAVEILISNARVKAAISDPTRSPNDLRQIIEQSKSLGMQSFDQSLMELYQSDLITKEEACLHCTNLHDFQLRLEGIVPGQWQEGREEVSISQEIRIKELLESQPKSIELDVDTIRKRPKIS